MLMRVTTVNIKCCLHGHVNDACYHLLNLELSLFSDTVIGVIAGKSLFYHLTLTAVWVIKMETFVLLQHSLTGFFMLSICILLSMQCGWHKRNLADVVQFQMAIDTEPCNKLQMHGFIQYMATKITI